MTKFVNRAKMNVSSSGTGTMTLSTAVDKHQSFIDAGVTNGETVRYVLEEGVNWEIGTGVFDSASGTLTRIVSESSNADALITLAGEATVFVTAGGEDLFAVANNLSDLANAATARTNLGLVIGTDVQGYDATLLNDADIGVTVQAYNAAIPTSKATTAQAEAGTDDATYMTPLKTVQSITENENVENTFLQGTWNGGVNTTESLISPAKLDAKIKTLALGEGQTWVSPSRANNTTYTNTTGRAILVSTWSNTGTAGRWSRFYVDGTMMWQQFINSGTSSNSRCVVMLVPAGSTYMVEHDGGLATWRELR